MKTKIVFACQNCGYQSPKWLGKCPECSNWNSFLEEDYSAPGLSVSTQRVMLKDAPVLLGEVKPDKEPRVKTGIKELDRALGGGIVSGSVTLLAGDPGIGKSTLSLQLCISLAKLNHKVLYVSGEESIKQIKLRADRLKAQDSDNFYLVNQTDISLIADSIKKIKPQFVIIDSVQVVNSAGIPSGAGTVSQVRECTGILTNLAKSLNIAMFIVGHVTKDGAIAGPRVLEHIVDTVLYFEGERYSIYRILRTVKNRFGPTHEIGVFEMEEEGLKEIINPSQIFLSERLKEASGSIVVSAIEGTRPILAEIQALVSRCSFGFAQRKAKGIDSNRLSLLIAVLEKRIGLNLGTEDIFINVAGGLRLDDPACDLGVVISIASSFKNRAVSSDLVAVGEVGLSGDVRSVSYLVQRITEAERLGFKRCILPKANFKDKALTGAMRSMEYIPVATIKEAMEITLV
ncbi:MAG TPA: DNA repair protein RadA [Candidatus Omnitrophica bacterium]|nr:DNA repair protein RadA [Candidatus Omnitrophota bacterium]